MTISRGVFEHVSTKTLCKLFELNKDILYIAEVVFCMAKMLSCCFAAHTAFCIEPKPASRESSRDPEKERDRERERDRECVCVCVRERERERVRREERERERESSTQRI